VVNISRPKLETMLVGGVILTLLIILLFGAIWAHFIRASDGNWAYVRHTREVIQKLGGLKIDLLELETSERGYLIAGRDSLLVRHAQAQAGLLRNQQELAAMVSDNSIQQQRANEVKPLIEARIDTSHRLVSLRDNFGLGSTQPLIVQELDQKGSDAVVTLIDQMLHEEQQLLDIRRDKLKGSFDNIGQMAIVSVVFIVLLLSSLVWAIRLDLRHRARLLMRLDQIAHHDMLTGLANRRYFGAAAEALLALSQRNGSMSALLMLDLDGFKKVNDTLGHEAGDALLKEVGGRLRKLSRDSDLLARLGGDEFVLLMPELHNIDGACVLAQKVVDALGEPYALGDAEPRPLVGASVGVAWYPDHGEDLDTLMRHADLALYAAKNAGRRQYAVYNKAAMMAPATEAITQS
jgi:diguanylate cyclase (GGDEF)-like protein